MQSTLRHCNKERVILISASLVLGAILAALGGCQGLPANVANCPSTPAPPANTSVVPPASEPPPAALCGFPLSISSPANGASVNSPVPIVAAATPPDPIYTVRVYVDGFAIMYSPHTNVNQLIWMPNGPHTVEIVAEDTAGYIATASLQLNVIGQEPGALNIQDSPNWVSCSAVLASGSTCAAGLGTAVSSFALGQSSPSLDGSAAKFSLSGSHPYSNELYWTPLGGGDNVSHFTYDLWFYIDNGDAPQSLEFDVNQAFGGTRWTWGTQCDFDQTHHWDIWDPLNGVWRPTSVPCNHFPSNTWIHLIWRFERVGNQVHYISVSVADQVYDVDTYYTAQPKWYQEEIDIAFQMDGNYAQQPYSVWLDEVNLLTN
jgi:Big-like domain-containing protein